MPARRQARLVSVPVRFRALSRSFAFKAVAVAAALFAILAAPTAAVKCPAGTVPISRTKCGTPVTTTLEFFDTVGALSTISDDGFGAYSNGIDGVLSYLLEDGVNGLKHDWYFDTQASAGRRVTETLSQADRITSGPHFTPWVTDPPYWGSVASKSRMLVKCTNVGVDLMAMEAGEVRTCALLNNFYYNGDEFWALSPGRSWTGLAETTDVEVVCNNDEPLRGCNDWSIRPIDDATIGVQAVGRLVHDIPSGKGRFTKEMGGNFYMRFHIRITRP